MKDFIFSHRAMVSGAPAVTIQPARVHCELMDPANPPQIGAYTDHGTIETIIYYTDDVHGVETDRGSYYLISEALLRRALNERFSHELA